MIASIQVKGLASAINPCHSLKSNAILFGLGDPCNLQAFLYSVIEDIWFCDLDV